MPQIQVWKNLNNQGFSVFTGKNVFLTLRFSLIIKITSVWFFKIYNLGKANTSNYVQKVTVEAIYSKSDIINFQFIWIDSSACYQAKPNVLTFLLNLNLFIFLHYILHTQFKILH